MRNSKSWKLRHLIIVGYAVPVLAMIISSVVTVLNVNTVDQKVTQGQISRKIDGKIADLAVDVQVAARSVRGYLLDQAPVSRESFQAAHADFDQIVIDLSGMVRDPQQKQTLAELKKLLDEYAALDEQLVEMVDAGKVDEAIKVWRMDNGVQRNTAVTALIDKMKDREDEIVNLDTQQQQEALNGLKTTVLLAAFFSLVFSVLIGYLLIRRIARKMDETASAIASSTSEIAATVEQQERTANQQAASVSETTTTMDELGASSRQSAEQAEAAAAGARQALVLAGSGTKAVERTMEGMGTLRQKVGAIADQILRLSEQTNQIGSISGLVSDLANQTNMLALNAAVEAVRAGEHGKGFAVVAGEIRKLADQSKNSAAKISALVTDIQNAINATVMATDEGTKNVAEGVKIAEETSESFSGVADAVNNVVLNSQQISLNVKQQAIAVQQVVEAMNALNTAARETANGIGQIKVGTQRLNDAASNLKATV